MNKDQLYFYNRGFNDCLAKGLNPIKEFTDEEKKGLYKAIYSRRDVRSHFTSRSIKDDILSRILNAAHHAPSVGFSQPWTFILIKDIITKKKIKDSFEEEKNRSSKLVEEPKRSKYISFKPTKAPPAPKDFISPAKYHK